MDAKTHRISLTHHILARMPGIGRYSAGVNPTDCVNRAVTLSKKGFGAICNVLGEHDTDDRVINRSIEEYTQVIEALAKEKKALVRPSISIKPTQFGFYCEKDKCDNVVVEHRIDKIIDQTASKGIFTWLDMENHTTTDFTIQLYKKASKKYGDRMIGIALQANLKRTHKDLQELIALSKNQNVHIRFVKGIYPEKEDIAYVTKSEQHTNLGRLIEYAFEHGNEGLRISVGSHHPIQIAHVIELNKEHPRLHDFQFLYGAARKIPEYLVSQGYACTYYVPSGPRFFAYGMRRIKENPNTVFGLLFSPFYEDKNLKAIKDYFEKHICAPLGGKS